MGSSIGISLYPLDGETADALMERADEAMYQAKAAGRNQFRLTGLETDDNQAERMAENLPHA